MAYSCWGLNDFIHHHKKITMRKIKVPAGIGDSIWLLQKLINSGEQFDFELPDGIPQRGKQIFDMLPQVANSCTYVPGLSYDYLNKHNAQAENRYFSQVREQEFCLSANSWLERGKRIEQFWPDLTHSWRMPWVTEGHGGILKIENFETLSGRPAKFIGIYGSAYSTTRAWGGWQEPQWLELINLLRDKDPDYVFVIIGAPWDIDLGRNIVMALSEAQVPHVNTIGLALPAVTEIMKQLHYFFCFPSGLGMLASTVGCPVAMFYPQHLAAMINAWAPPEDIASGAYKGCLFCPPVEIFDWATANGKV
jgi:hypothetical protein